VLAVIVLLALGLRCGADLAVEVHAGTYTATFWALQAGHSHRISPAEYDVLLRQHRCGSASEMLRFPRTTEVQFVCSISTP
jgi:hypothetical protein